MRFSSDISVWLLIPWLVLSIYAGFWFYSKTPWLSDLKPLIKQSLKILRSSVIFILGVLLIGLIFESVEYRNEKPIIISLVDNSSSMTNFKDSTTLRTGIGNYQQLLHDELGQDYEIVEMTVGSDVSLSEKVNFSSSISNLSAGFEKIQTEYYNRNVGAVLFISDGNFNAGNNPVYAAEKINLTPVFALGTGDTVQKRDQYVKNIAANEVAFFKNKFPVEVDLEGIKMGKVPVTVSISKNGKVMASKTVTYKDGKRDFEHVSFLIEADQIGFQSYTVTVNNAANEYNYKNNKRTFYIEVIDSRSKVLILAGAPHPDVASMKWVLDQDENLEVNSIIAKNWDKNLSKVDFVIWHEPGINYDATIANILAEKKIPVLYFIGPNTSSSVIQKLGLGVTASPGNQTDESQGAINESFQQFEISEELKKSFSFYPPLKTKFGDLKVSGGVEILAYQRIGSIRKKDPLIYFGKKGAMKYGVIYGEGIWKWKVNEFVRTGEQSSFTELIQKTTQYLLVKQNTSALRVTFPKRFTKDEEVLVNASFYNESMEPITKPKIKLEVVDEKGKELKLDFGVIGDFYRCSLGKMKPGKYTWKATSSYNGKTFRKEGVFVVEDIEVESLDTYANHQLLKQMSSNSNGKFFTFENYKKAIDAIKKRDDITSVSFKEASFNDLIDYKILFFLLLFLLSAEWFLRRWYGSY